MFGLPLARVQVIVPYLGGAYGNKSYTKIEPLVALARKVGARCAWPSRSKRVLRPCGAAARVRVKTGEARWHHGGPPVHRTTRSGPMPMWDRAWRRPATRPAGRIASALAHRHLCGLFQHRQQRRIPWLRGAATRLGLRVADGHHGRASGLDPLDMRLKICCGAAKYSPQATCR